MRRIVLAALLVCSAVAFDGCVTTTQAPPIQPNYASTYQPAPPPPPPPRGYEAQPPPPPAGYIAPEEVEVYVQLDPPPPPVERPGRPRRGFTWVPGHWEWAPRAGTYAWIPGHWERSLPGRLYVPGHWDRRPRGWVWIPGYWR